MGYIVAFCVGVLMGLIIFALIVTNNINERTEEAYNRGIEDGKIIALNMHKS